MNREARRDQERRLCIVEDREGESGAQLHVVDAQFLIAVGGIDRAVVPGKPMIVQIDVLEELLHGGEGGRPCAGQQGSCGTSGQGAVPGAANGSQLAGGGCTTTPGPPAAERRSPAEANRWAAARGAGRASVAPGRRPASEVGPPCRLAASDTAKGPPGRRSPGSRHAGRVGRGRHLSQGRGELHPLGESRQESHGPPCGGNAADHSGGFHHIPLCNMAGARRDYNTRQGAFQYPGTARASRAKGFGE